MQIFDVTVPISESVPIFEGDPLVRIRTVMSITNGDAANISEITFGVHTGTHVDAPSHFIEGGPAIAEIDPAKLIGPCRVVSISPEVIEIGPEHLIDLQGFERILFKTRNSEL